MRQGWGAYYWNNGNSYQGRVVANVMEGQALHFRWGDGAKFQCAELKDCFRQGSIDKTNGVFKSVNKDRRPDTLVEKYSGSSGRAKGPSTTSMGTAMLANGREISQKGKEYITTQTVTGMKVFLTLESS